MAVAWLDDERLARETAAALERIDIAVIPVLDHVDLLRVLEERRSSAGSPSTLVLTEARTRRDMSKLAGLVATYPQLWIAVVTREKAFSLGVPSTAPAAQARICEIHARRPDRIARIVGDLSLSLAADVLSVAVRDALRNESVRLRQAISEVLTCRALRADLTGPPPVESQRRLSSRLGLSRSYVGRLARGAQVDLGYLIDLWRVILALHVRRVWEVPWEVVAWRVGFASHSGLAALVRRTVGLTLTELDRSGLEELLEDFSAALHSAKRTG